jgi:rod shape-determining protein MreD
MRRTLLWVLVFVALVLQVTAVAKIEILGTRPDTVLVVLVYVALAFGAVVGCLVGFAVGLAELAIMSNAVASLPLAGTVVGFVVGKYATKIMYESVIVQILIIFASVVIFDVINMLYLAPGEFAGNFLRWSLPGAAYTALLGAGLVFLLERVFSVRLLT